MFRFENKPSPPSNYQRRLIRQPNADGAWPIKHKRERIDENLNKTQQLL